MQSSRLKQFAAFCTISAVGGLGALQFIPKFHESRQLSAKLKTKPLSSLEKKSFENPLPTREAQVARLSNEDFDILVVGGGATGTGVALDAITRGLKVALVEKFDFSSGTSSRSTKLIHGGVRYLQKAMMNLDIDQYKMVVEALHERFHLVEVAPHLAQPLPIMLPLYKWWQLPYYWVGIKMYDVVSWSKILKASYYLNKSRALENFPMLNKDELKGAIVYYDGQQNDARMNVSLAVTAARLGAAVSNYTEVTQLNHDPDGKLTGALIRDNISGRELSVKARCIINATGPYTDFMRLSADPQTPRICAPSSGMHITLPGYYSPRHMGLLDPATKDGRVIFFLPWENHTIAGTTDIACQVTDHPAPTEPEIQFILEEIRHYLGPGVKVRRGDVHSAWTGIRPLVRDPSKKDTQSLARNHIVEVSRPSGLITIAGGKWTTYRHMAEEAVDAAVREHQLPVKSGCQTSGLRIEGGHTYDENVFIKLSQDYGIEPLVARHLAHTYGDRSYEVAQMSQLTGKRWPLVGIRLHPDYPYLEAEVVYACREYARRVVDVIARRTRLAFVNGIAAVEVIPRVADIMAKELGWDRKTKEAEIRAARQFVDLEMGLDLRNDVLTVPVNFSQEETNRLVREFNHIDTGRKGYITVQDLRKHVANDSNITEEHLREILNEVDSNRNGEIDITEYLQFMSALKTGVVSDSRFGQIVDRAGAKIDMVREM